MPWLEPVTLSGPHAQLRPLSHDHVGGLTEAVRDGELWKLWYTFVPTPEGMGKEIDRRLGLQAAGAMLPFTVFDAEGRIAGMSTYMNVDASNRRVEIGSTWYARRVQRSALNTQCKLLVADARLRETRLHCGRVPHPFLQPPEPARHRTAGRQTGRHPAQPSDCIQRHAARYRGLQHHRRRMADGKSASDLSIEREAACIAFSSESLPRT